MPMYLDHKRADRVATVLIQEALTKQGYTPGPADGRFGLQTLRAVVAFQTAHDLTPTGGVDEALCKSISTGKAPPAKKAPAEKKPAAKPAAKSTAAKKPAAKKPAAKKAPAKKPSVTT